MTDARLNTLQVETLTGGAFTDRRLHTHQVEVLTGSNLSDRRLQALRVEVLYNTQPPANDLWIWDGAVAQPANVTVWNGSAEIQTTVAVT